MLNAGCADKDLAHIRKYLEPFRKSGKDVTLTEHRDRGLLGESGRGMVEWWWNGVAWWEMLLKVVRWSRNGGGGACGFHVYHSVCVQTMRNPDTPPPPPAALQGPAAADALQKHVKMDLSKFYFSNFAKVDINGAHCYLTRTGYTGEGG